MNAPVCYRFPQDRRGNTDPCRGIKS